MTGLAFALLAGLLLMSMVLLGRYILLIAGVSLPALPMVFPDPYVLPDGVTVLIWVAAGLCLFVSRPSWLRRGHEARITRNPA